jgi:hypothetical protein
MSDTATAAPAEAAPDTSKTEGLQDVTQEGKPTGEPLSKGGTTEAQAQAAAKKAWKLDDEEEYEDAEALAKAAKRYKAEAKARAEAEKYLETAWADRQKLEALKRGAKDRTEETLRELGIDPSEFAKRHILQRIQEEKEKEGLSAEQLKERDEVKSAKRELAELKAKLAEREKTEEAEKLKAYQQERRQYFVGVINQALSETSLPNNPQVQSLMAEEMRRAIKYGIKLNPTLIAKKVEERYWGDVDSRIPALDAKTLLKRYPKLAEDIRKAALEERGIKTQPAPAPETTPSEKPPAEKKSNWLSPAEYQRIIKSRLK